MPFLEHIAGKSEGFHNIYRLKSDMKPYKIGPLQV